MTDPVESLIESSKALPLPDQLRLAAELLEHAEEALESAPGKALQISSIVRAIAERAVAELGAALAAGGSAR